MRPLVPALLAAGLLVAASAPAYAFEFNEYLFNSYRRDAETANRKGTEAFRAADDATTKEDACSNAWSGVTYFRQAYEATQGMVSLFQYGGGDRDTYDLSVEFRGAAGEVYEQALAAYNRACES